MQLAELVLADALNYVKTAGEGATPDHASVQLAQKHVADVVSRYPEAPGRFRIEHQLYQLQWTLAPSNENFERLSQLVRTELVGFVSVVRRQYDGRL